MSALCLGLLAPAGAVADTPAITGSGSPVECSVIQADGSLLPVAAPSAGVPLAANEICITAETLKAVPAPAATRPKAHRRAHHRHHRRRHHHTRA